MPISHVLLGSQKPQLLAFCQAVLLVFCLTQKTGWKSKVLLSIMYDPHELLSTDVSEHTSARATSSFSISGLFYGHLTNHVSNSWHVWDKLKKKLCLKDSYLLWDAWGWNWMKYTLLVYCKGWMMNFCFNAKGLIGTKHRTAVLER